MQPSTRRYHRLTAADERAGDAADPVGGAEPLAGASTWTWECLPSARHERPSIARGPGGLRPEAAKRVEIALTVCGADEGDVLVGDDAMQRSYMRRERRSCLSTLPIAFLGSASTTWSCSGHFWMARPSRRQCSRKSFSSTWHPSRRTT